MARFSQDWLLYRFASESRHVESSVDVFTWLPMRFPVEVFAQARRPLKLFIAVKLIPVRENTNLFSELGEHIRRWYAVDSIGGRAKRTTQTTVESPVIPVSCCLDKSPISEVDFADIIII